MKTPCPAKSQLILDSKSSLNLILAGLTKGSVPLCHLVVYHIYRLTPAVTGFINKDKGTRQ